MSKSKIVDVLNVDGVDYTENDIRRLLTIEAKHKHNCLLVKQLSNEYLVDQTTKNTNSLKDTGVGIHD